MNVYQSFVEVAKRYRGMPAVIYLGEVLNYGDFWPESTLLDRIAVAGSKERDKIIIYMPNTPQWIISWLSIQKIGAAAVPIAPIYTSRDLRYISDGFRGTHGYLRGHELRVRKGAQGGRDPR